MAEAVNDQRSTSLPARRRKIAALVLGILLTAGTFGVLAARMSWFASAEPRSELDYPVPDFRLATLDGDTVGPQDFAGDVVVVEFWATWCIPCRLQARFLEQLHAELAGEGVRFLAVDAGEDPDTVRRFVEEHPFPYPVLLDPEDSLGVRYRIIGLPTVMIIDRQGAISFLEVGVSDIPTLRRELEAAGLAI